MWVKSYFPQLCTASADHSQNIGLYNFVKPDNPNQETDNVSYFLWGGRFALFRSQEILPTHSSQDIVNVFASPSQVTFDVCEIKFQFHLLPKYSPWNTSYTVI